MPTELEKQITRDGQAIAFLRGFKHGVTVQPKPAKTTGPYEEGYAQGRICAGVALNSWLESVNIEKIPSDQVINLLARA